ncbi:MAG TPA: hypothetical protein VKU01_10595 [Bryobacteraceae bacterium]|nr:hypothetical protein [Bryobacteraceae bacterium]
MKTWIVAVILAAPAFAAVDGTIVNGTTGKPQPNVVVSLVEPTQAGMQNLGSAKTDAEGKFRFEKGGAGGPQLVQAIYDGVMYNRMLPPGTPTSGVQVEVYEASTKPDVAQVAQDMILYQPSDSQVTVNESVIFQNGSKTTYNDPKGTFRFYLPPEAAGKVNVTVVAPGGMPVQRPAEKTKDADVYAVSYAVKPGETRFDLSYSFPSANPLVVSGKVLHKEGPTRLVVPAGVTLKSDDVTALGEEPQTKASIFEVKGKEFKAELSGSGALSSGDSTGAPADDDSGAPQIHEIQPHVYDKLPWILGIALVVLALGFVVLYRSDRAEAVSAVESPAPAKPERERKGAVSR